MARRSKASTKSTTDSRSESLDGAKPSGGWKRVVTFLLAAWGAVAGTLALSKSGAAPASAAGKDNLEARFASEESRIRTDIGADLKKAIKDAKEVVAIEGKKASEARDQARTIKEAIEGQGEAAAQAIAKRSEVIDARVEDVSKDTIALKDTVALHEAAIRDLKLRPTATGPVAPTREPIPTKPTVATPSAPGAEALPAGPTPEQIAANKDKVRTLIADLLTGLTANELAKVFNSCLKLGNMGDLDAVEPIVRVLKEFKDPYGKSAAATALGRLHACDAIPALLATFGDKDNTVVVNAAHAFTQITGFDMAISGDPSRKDKNEAKEKCTKWWKDHEAEVRAKWNQPAGGAAPAAPGGDGSQAPGGGAPGGGSPGGSSPDPKSDPK